MTPDELTEYVRQLRATGTDDADVEAKAARTSLPKSVRDTLSAFSNTRGGVIILGVAEEEAFRATGVEDPGKVAADLAALASNNMEPPLRPLIEVHEFEGVKLVTAEVPALDDSLRPCFYKGAGMARGSFVRVNDGDYQLSSYEVQMMLSGRGQPTEDMQVIADCSPSDLDPGLVRAYIAS